MNDDITTEIKYIPSNQEKVVIAVRNGLLSSRCPGKMAKYDVHRMATQYFELSLYWVQRRGTTGKEAMNPALYEELTFSWKRKLHYL